MSSSHHYDQWYVDGNPTFGTIPGGCIPGLTADTPIYLFRGNKEWGWEHIGDRHSQNNLFKYATTIEEVIWARCGTEGSIHKCDSEDKLTVSISLAPRAFMVLNYVPDIAAFSITTMYSKRKENPYDFLMPYAGRPPATSRPIFSLAPHAAPAAPVVRHQATTPSAVPISFVKKRVIHMPCTIETTSKS